MDTLNRLSSKKHLKYTIYLVAIAVFFGIILIPPIIGIFIKAPEIGNFLQYPDLVNAASIAIANSFIIGLIVAALDLLAGIPLAWMITRSKSRWISILDTLADLTLYRSNRRVGLLASALLEQLHRHLKPFQYLNCFTRIHPCHASALHIQLPSRSPRTRRRHDGLQDGVRTRLTHPWVHPTNSRTHRNFPNPKTLTTRSVLTRLRTLTLRNRRHLHRSRPRLPKRSSIHPGPQKQPRSRAQSPRQPTRAAQYSQA